MTAIDGLLLRHSTHLGPPRLKSSGAAFYSEKSTRGGGLQFPPLEAKSFDFRSVPVVSHFASAGRIRRTAGRDAVTPVAAGLEPCGSFPAIGLIAGRRDRDLRANPAPKLPVSFRFPVDTARKLATQNQRCMEANRWLGTWRVMAYELESTIAR